MSKFLEAVPETIEEFDDEVVTPELAETDEDLLKAVKSKDYATAERLMASCDVNYIDSAGFSPAYLAAQNGDARMLDVLIIGGADLNLIDVHDQESVIFKCAASGSAIATNSLIEAAKRHNIDLNLETKSSSGKTALYEAVEAGYEDIVKLLLGAGAAIDVLNPKKDTLLTMAASNGDARMVKLITHTAKKIYSSASYEKYLNYRGQKGTAFMVAMDCNRRDLAEFLLVEGANINQRISSFKINPILLCAKRGDISGLAFLIDNGANLESANSVGDTPLCLVIESGRLDALELLIKSGANVNGKVGFDIEFNPPICHALTSNLEYREVAVESLLMAGADLNQIDYMGRNILYRAIKDENCELVESLFAAAIKYNIPLDLRTAVAHSGAAASLGCTAADSYDCIALADHVNNPRINDALVSYVNTKPTSSPFKPAAKSKNQNQNFM